MLLLYPPLARSTEPPLGIARLAGMLKAAGRECACLDLCQEGYEYLLSLDFPAADPFSAGAKKRRGRALSLLRSPLALENADRYARAVSDLNRCLARVGKDRGLSISLSDYQDAGLSPLRKADLIESAHRHRESIFSPLYEKRIGEALASGAYAAIGISICFLSQALPAFALIGFLRERFPDRKIVLGGSLIGSWVGQGCLAPNESFGGLADALLPGRGEDALLDWLEGREAGKAEGEGIRPSAAPDFSDFEGLEYFSPKRVLPYNFSSGCPWLRCRFCPERVEGYRYRGREPEIALREIKSLVERHRPALIHFTDSELGRPYLRALADHPPGPPWYGFARFQSDLLDPLFCRRLKESGCAMLQLGLESGDQEVLDALDKGTRLSDIEIILANLKAAGIGSFIYLLFGTRAEELSSARRTLAFVEAQARAIDFLNLAIFNLPAAGSEEEGVELREFSEADLSLYREFSHPGGWNRDRVRAFLSREFEASAAIRPILLRSPPTFTSNHAAFFLD
jgi:hypothetical protein